MKRAAPWIIAVAAIIAFVASFSELQRMRRRFGEVKFLESEVRQYMIRAAVRSADRPVVFLGDSITERAKLPATINGRPVVNAGVGGASISSMHITAPALLDGSRPSLIVIALGTNDGGAASIQRDYASLLEQMKAFSPNLIALAVPNSEVASRQIRDAASAAGVPFVKTNLPENAFLSDGIHLSPEGYRVWVPAIVAAAAGG